MPLMDAIRAAITRQPKTKEQRPKDDIGDIFGFDAQQKGYGRPPDGTFKTYREMRNHPTTALAKAIATGPIRGSDWNVEADDDVSENLVAEVEDEFLAHREPLVEQAMRALEYGFQAWELVWIPKDGRYVVDKYKSLMPDKTDVLTDDHGNYMGLENDGVRLSPVETLWYSHDKECDNWYGRSRYENYRELVYRPWLDTQRSQGVYAKRVAVPTLQIHYPMGTSLDRSGAKVDNYELAVKLKDQMAQAHHVCIPNELVRHASDLARQGVDITKLRAWFFDYLETKSQHGSEFIDSMRHYDALIFRAWLVPERAGTEGQFGTKAEAAEHGNVGLMVSELTQREMMRYFNRYLVDRYLLLNHGAQWKGKVRLKAKPIDDKIAQLFREIVTKVLGENPDIWQAMIDTVGVYQQLGLPVEDVLPQVPQLPTDDDLLKEAAKIGAGAAGRGNGSQ